VLDTGGMLKDSNDFPAASRNMKSKVLVRNPRLRAALHEWVSESLVTLAPLNAVGYDGLSRVLAEHDYADNQTYLSLVINLLATTPTFERLLHVVRDSRPASKLLLASIFVFGESLPTDLLPRQLQNTCIRFLSLYIDTAQGVDFDEPLFSDLYAKLEDLIYRNRQLPARWLVYIRNLALGDFPVILSAGLILRPTSHSEEEMARIRAAGRHVTNQVRTVLEIRHQTSIGIDIDREYPQRMAERLMIALRLGSAEYVEVDNYEWEMIDQPLQPFRLTYIPPPPTIPGPQKVYMLSPDLVTALRAVWRKLVRIHALPEVALETAFTRFNDSYSRIKAEDKILDLWIAFESMFFPPQVDSGQMQAAIALAVAHYLGDTEAARSMIYADLRHSYAWRSYVIHGKRKNPPEQRGVPKIQQKSLDAVASETQSYLRRALRRRVEE
jgi:hypothetical protein